MAQPYYMNKKYFAAAATILAVAIVVLWLANIFLCQPTAFSFARTQEREQPEKTVYLTFDDGPSDRITPKILDILDNENVKATFFIIGIQAATRNGIIRREHESGHTVAVHSYTHIYSDIYRSAEALIDDIDRCNAVIKKITGARSEIYRFPGGSFGLDGKLISAVTEHGLRYVDWNASTRDAERCTSCAEDLYHYAISSAADSNNIVLLAHDSTNKVYTPDATRMIIRYYKQRGYSFGTF